MGWYGVWEAGFLIYRAGPLCGGKPRGGDVGEEISVPHRTTDYMRKKSLISGLFGLAGRGCHEGTERPQRLIYSAAPNFVDYSAASGASHTLVTWGRS